MKREATAEEQTLSARQVADVFVQHYYSIIRNCPENAHKFYKEDSIMARLGSDGTMLSVTTVQGIDEAIMSSGLGGWEPDVESVHAQYSVMGSVIVGVTGILIEKNSAKQNFAQTFLLAPQGPCGFYVHNDFLLFRDVKPTATLAVHEDGANSLTATSPKDSAASPYGSGQGNADVPKTKQEVISDSDPTPKEAFGNLKRVGGTTAGLNKSPPTSVRKAVLNAQPDSTKVSYASILAKETARLPSPSFAALIKAEASAPMGAPSLTSRASAPPSNGAAGGNNQGRLGWGGHHNDYNRASTFEGCGSRNVGEALGSNWRKLTEEPAPGGSSTATK